MWQRFTERARRAIYYSQEEAARLCEDKVRTEHLLLGLLREEDTVAARIIEMCGRSLEDLRTLTESYLEVQEGEPPKEFTLTPRGKRTIDLAYEEARNLANNYIGTEHLLLGLIRNDDSLAGRILFEARIYPEDARKATLEIQDAQRTGREPLNRIATLSAGTQATLQEVPLNVQYDLQLLHPVDQMLLALLTDTESDLGQELHYKFQALRALLPSIVAVMANSNVENRSSLSFALNFAHEVALQAGRSFLLPQDLYIACAQVTAPEVRVALHEMDIDPLS
jgi:hypothetical protein